MMFNLNTLIWASVNTRTFIHQHWFIIYGSKAKIIKILLFYMRPFTLVAEKKSVFNH